MGFCIHCSKPAGWFRKVHKECKIEFDAKQAMIAAFKADETKEIKTLAANAIVSSVDSERIAAYKKLQEPSVHISPESKKSILETVWVEKLQNFLSDGVLDSDEQARLESMKKFFGLYIPSSSMELFNKALVIRTITEGNIPSTDFSTPARLVKNEHVIWRYDNVSMLQDKTKVVRKGRSAGTRVRVAKGIYVTLGASKGYNTEVTNRVKLADGIVTITNKYFHFTGTKSKRISMDSIISVEEYSDGICLFLDKGEPLFFIGLDGWFVANIILNIGE